MTRHMNEIYASTAFITLAANPVTADATTVTAVLDFVFALASTSIASAANARSVERLVPFYRGTLSNRDRSLLDLFQRVEMMSPASISPLLRAWIPTFEPDASLDGTRIGALAVADKKAIRRSWARAFASSRIRYSATENAKTYDPVFLVGFLAALIDEDDMKPQDWTLLLESGVLGTAVAALASSSYALRGLARATFAALAERIKVRLCRDLLRRLLRLTRASALVAFDFPREGRARTRLDPGPTLDLFAGGRAPPGQHRALPRSLHLARRRARVPSLPYLYALPAATIDDRCQGCSDVLLDAVFEQRGRVRGFASR